MHDELAGALVRAPTIAEPCRDLGLDAFNGEVTRVRYAQWSDQPVSGKRIAPSRQP